MNLALALGPRSALAVPHAPPPYRPPCALAALPVRHSLPGPRNRQRGVSQGLGEGFCLVSGARQSVGVHAL